jgi:hypothetical protein
MAAVRGASMTARVWPISHARSWSLLGASVLIFAALLLSSQLALAQFTQQGSKLVGSGASGAAVQGWSVALSADGNTALVGGFEDNSGTGAAWVYARNGGLWTQQGSKLVGSGGIGAAVQGVSVALSGDGNTAIVGGFDDNSKIGAAWVYTRANGVWTQQGSKLLASDAVGNAQQGNSVALSADGNTAIVGGPYDNEQIGAAWVYARNGGLWTQQGSKLVGSGGIGTAQQGISVALSADGNTAIVGGPYDNGNSGAAWVFVQPQTVQFSAFSVHLTIYPIQAEFSISSNFTLGATSNGINPPAEPVTLQIGSFIITIPPGSFVMSGRPGNYTFVGVINGVNLNLLISLTGGNNCIFGAIAKNVQLPIVNPVAVTLTIGDDSGATAVNGVIINTK